MLFTRHVMTLLKLLCSSQFCQICTSGLPFFHLVSEKVLPFHSRQEKLDEGHPWFEAVDLCPGREEETPKCYPGLQVLPMQWLPPMGSPDFNHIRVFDGE